MGAIDRMLTNAREYDALKGEIAAGRFPLGVLGLSQSPRALVIAALAQTSKAVIITPDEPSSVRLCDDLNVLGIKCRQFPCSDLCFRSDESRGREYEKKRIGALCGLLDGECVTASIQAAMQLTIPAGVLEESRTKIEVGDELDVEKLTSLLVSGGYVRCDLVEGEGQFSVRGLVIDVFPPSYSSPVRLELWGDTVDSISLFDVFSQRRTSSIEKLCLTPAQELICRNPTMLAMKIRETARSVRGKNAQKVRETLINDAVRLESGILPPSLDKYYNLIYENGETLFDYVGDRLLILTDSFNIKEQASSALKLHAQDLAALYDEGTSCKSLGAYLAQWDYVLAKYGSLRTIYIDNFPRGSFDTPIKELISFSAGTGVAWNGSLSALLEDIPRENRGITVVFSGTKKSAGVLAGDLESNGVPAVYFDSIPEEFSGTSVNVLPGSLSSSAELAGGKIRIITIARQVGGSVTSAKRKKRAAGALHSIEELEKGDYVVHETHGIGIFDGIVEMTVSGVRKDYIKIKYLGSDVLYVPVSQLDLVSKYIGATSDGEKKLKLSRLGGKDWEKTKQRVRSAVNDMADELLALYAKRQATPGYAFSPDIDMQRDFECRFGYDETEDQLRCVYEIKRDMEKPYPMDRLLCGDVGFGKTEVALRAAFKCVADGKQCAILVPTTILAMQHYRTILSRFEGFPVNIDMVSRFKSDKENELSLKALAAGRTDIIVGTHRLISKDVRFKDLGLLIIDEEQRFGVGQKEKLKADFPAVDVLTLSATPIPRTLNMAMTGIRDMSTIEEAPTDRYPVQTFVVEYDLSMLANAIRRELRRGGQVYYLYNNVEHINSKALELHELIPEARIGVAHGKMNELELSEIWRRLTEGELDVLVCTTIIETGVDVPNCNTLIIEKADRFGLAQLHQLRGRVGRSSRRAYAYMTYDGNKVMNEVAEKRLSAIREYTQFGSGFKIALKDLELRGAGSVLGAKQHGHLAAVGYDMYLKLLDEVVTAHRESRDGEAPPVKIVPECRVDVAIEAHIPESYISATPQRLSMYRRIAEIRTGEDASDVIDELTDRYGEPGDGVMGLIFVSLLRARAQSFGVTEIRSVQGGVELITPQLDMDLIGTLAPAFGSRLVIFTTGKPRLDIKYPAHGGTFELLKELSAALAQSDGKTGH